MLCRNDRAIGKLVVNAVVVVDLSIHRPFPDQPPPLPLTTHGKGIVFDPPNDIEFMAALLHHEVAAQPGEIVPVFHLEQQLTLPLDPSLSLVHIGPAVEHLNQRDFPDVSIMKSGYDFVMNGRMPAIEADSHLEAFFPSRFLHSRSRGELLPHPLRQAFP
jgi:hypothetical protein